MSGVFVEEHVCTANPAAPTLVLLHGWGLHSGVWRDFLPLLTPHVHVRCIDLPGFGRSSAMTPPATLDGMVDAVMQAAPARAVWAGWSLGGLVALAVAARHPERVTALVLLAATPCFVQRGHWATAMPQAHFDAFLRAVRQDAGIALKQFLALQCKGSDTMKNDLRFLQETLRQQDLPAASALFAGLAVLGESDLRDRVTGLDVPLLALTGEHDGLVPAVVGAALQELDPHCAALVIAGAAHAPFVSHPVQCRDAVLTFIREIHE